MGKQVPVCIRSLPVVCSIKSKYMKEINTSAMQHVNASSCMYKINMSGLPCHKASTYIYKINSSGIIWYGT